MGCPMCLSAEGPSKPQSKLTKRMRLMLRLLQLNFFDKRDMMALLRRDSLRHDQMNIYQMTLI
jgi:hypothetical protein